MIMTIERTYSYDNEFDILYLNIGDYSPSIADEIIDYVYVKKSDSTDEITQIIIEDFSNFDIERLNNTEIALLKKDIKRIKYSI